MDKEKLLDYLAKAILICMSLSFLIYLCIVRPEALLLVLVAAIMTWAIKRISN